MTIFKAVMPTNIAFIKYMGKKDAVKNIPDNASLSYTLENLTSTVTLTKIEADKDCWGKENSWSDNEKKRFENHLLFLKKQFDYKGAFEIASDNNFPAQCGLASSASSFAALTQCAISAFGVSLSAQEIANLSRQGSGSSCRSFFAPFALWSDEKVDSIDLPYSKLIHYVVVVSRDKKAVSSSDAHRKVQSSLLYANRISRAEHRLNALIESLKEKDWEKSYDVIWQEFWDMHALFETSETPFGYFLPGSLDVLLTIRKLWQDQKDGPLVTMDAGPNVHLFFREDQKIFANSFMETFKNHYFIL